MFLDLDLNSKQQLIKTQKLLQRRQETICAENMKSGVF